MCFQGYVYFACGHNRILTQDCELALTAEVPFYIKHECPNYHHASERPNYACGLGKFYCTQTPDGPFLDHVHTTAIQAQNTISQVDTQLVSVVALANKFNQQADEHQVSKEVRRRHEFYQRIATQHKQLTQHRASLVRTTGDASAIVQQARDYHTKLNEHVQSHGPSLYPPFVPAPNLFGRVPAEFSAASAYHTVYAPSTSFGAAYGVQLPPSPAGSNIQVVPRQQPPSAHPPGAPRKRNLALPDLPPRAHAVMQAQQAEAARQKLQTHDMRPPPRSGLKGGRPRKGVAAQEMAQKAGRRRGTKDTDSMEDDADSIRRSARVRNKKVNYAESTGSVSREPSPSKSDASGFSPAKSDDSGSFVKEDGSKRRNVREEREEARGLRPTAISLSDKLNDWARRGSVATAETPLQRRAMPVKDMLNSSPAQITTRSNATVPRQRQAFAGPMAGRPPATNSSINGLPFPSSVSNLATLATVAQEHGNQSQLPRSLQPPFGSNAAAQSIPLPVFTRTDSANSGQSAPPGVLDWLSQGQSVQSFSQPQFAPPPQPLTAQIFAQPSPVSWQSGSVASYKDRVDSVHDHADMGFNHLYRTPSFPSYESMRKSFGSTAVLTPSMAPSREASMTEQRKRDLPPSSPTLEPVKRMRLSLPSEQQSTPDTQDTNWLLGQGVELQQPDTSYTYQPAGTGAMQHTASFNSQDSMSAPLAPMLAPTMAASLQRTQADDSAEEAGEHDDNIRQTAVNEHDDEDDGPGLHFSDIDWGMPYDGAASPLPW